MAKRLFARTIISLKKCNVHFKGLHTNQIPLKEIQIPVKWGHISGKLWGNENERPILALHGWQDNAGTWDPLAPMLANNRPILAIDFPGHGLSSWYPPGMHYFAWDLPSVILKMKDHFKWDKISLLCHSMGSIAACRFACLFSDDVDFYVAIDSLIADDYDLNAVVERYPITLRKHQIDESRLEQEPPSYTLDQINTTWHMGTRKSVALESVPHLQKRGTKPSKKDPNKYYFSRDPRLKHILFNPEDKKFVEVLVKRLKCPTLYVKAIDSPYASDQFSVDMREVIENNNEKFECHFVPGTHHVHLNNPGLIAPLVVNFLKKHNLFQ